MNTYFSKCSFIISELTLSEITNLTKQARAFLKDEPNTFAEGVLWLRTMYPKSKFYLFAVIKEKPKTRLDVLNLKGVVMGFENTASWMIENAPETFSKN